MKTILFSLLLTLSYHLSEAQTKAALFKQIETTLNKAQGKIFTYQGNGNNKNVPRYVIKKQVFQESLIALSTAQEKTIFLEEHTHIDWTDAFEYWVFRKDPNDPAVSALDISFANEHTAKLSQDGKTYQEGKSAFVTLYFLTSDRDKLTNLMNAMAKLQ